MDPVLWQSDLPGYGPPLRGKVRDVYDLGDTLLIVATDRLSAYDFVLQPGIPDKGKILNQLSNFWFGHLAEVAPNHLLATEPEDFPAVLAPFREILRGRSVLARKARVVPFECVARGYLAGSGFREYQQTGTVCGIPLPAGLQRASQLPEPIYTPATKAEEGHDENVTFEHMARALGRAPADRLRRASLDLYEAGRAYAAERGIIIADTKFEFGTTSDGTLLVIDEILTPDSSRFWPADRYQPGGSQPSFDKQPLRDYLAGVKRAGKWNGNAPPPPLPAEVVSATSARYRDAYRRITGRELA